MMESWFVDIENNADFYSAQNQAFFVKVMTEFNFQTEKIVIFLPCASKKPISKSRTHCYLSPITKDEQFEKIIISEPQTIIPYQLESFCPNYDYPPTQLTINDRWQLIRRLGFFLNELKKANENRKYLFYIGARHHFAILNEANRILNQFQIIGFIPKRGIRDYNSAAIEFKNKILEKWGEVIF